MALKGEESSVSSQGPVVLELPNELVADRLRLLLMIENWATFIFEVSYIAGFDIVYGVLRVNMHLYSEILDRKAAIKVPSDFHSGDLVQNILPPRMVEVADVINTLSQNHIV